MFQTHFCSTTYSMTFIQKKTFRSSEVKRPGSNNSHSNKCRSDKSLFAKLGVTSKRCDAASQTGIQQQDLFFLSKCSVTVLPPLLHAYLSLCLSLSLSHTLTHSLFLAFIPLFYFLLLFFISPRCVRRNRPKNQCCQIFLGIYMHHSKTGII
jgi:hypothetical protein